VPVYGPPWFEEEPLLWASTEREIKNNRTENTFIFVEQNMFDAILLFSVI